MIPRHRTTAPSGPTRRLLLAALVTACVLVVTWAVRRWVEQTLLMGVPVPVLGEVFRLTRGENTGIAFGLLRDSALVPWLSLLALCAVALYLWRLIWQQRVGAAAIGLIFGGGVANLLDRLGDGRVTDYLDWGVGTARYATFNLPDSAIFVGFTLIILLAWRRPTVTARATDRRPAPAQGE